MVSVSAAAAAAGASSAADSSTRTRQEQPFHDSSPPSRSCEPVMSAFNVHELSFNRLRRLDVGPKLHHLLLPVCVRSPCSCAAPPGLQRCGLLREPGRAGDGPSVAA